MTPNPAPIAAPPIAYATPDAREPRRWFSLRTILLAIVITGLIQISFLIPLQFKPIFADFHLKLPGLTMVWLDLGDMWSSAYGWVIAWPLAIALAIGITLLRKRPQTGNEKLKWLLLSNLVLLAFNVCFVLTALAVYSPFVTLIEDISTSGGKK